MKLLDYQFVPVLNSVKNTRIQQHKQFLIIISRYHQQKLHYNDARHRFHAQEFGDPLNNLEKVSLIIQLTVFEATETSPINLPHTTRITIL